MGSKRIKKRKHEGNRNLKAPPLGLNDNFDQHKPRFSLEHIQPEHCLSRCNQTEKAHFADALLKRSRLTWSQLKSIDRHGLGYEKIKRSSIEVAIPEHITEDVNLIAFRFSGNYPMVGYRHQSTFFVLWVDRTHSVYRG